jgi:hypothetical protein
LVLLSDPVALSVVTALSAVVERVAVGNGSPLHVVALVVVIEPVAGVQTTEVGVVADMTILPLEKVFEMLMIVVVNIAADATRAGSTV